MYKEDEEMDVTVFGTGTSGHQYVSSTIRKYVEKAGLDIHVVESTKVSDFLENKISSVPAIKYKDEVITLKSNGSFNKSLRDAVKSILKKSNYGAMTQILIPIDFSETSANAFFFGHRLASDLGLMVKLVHVFTPVVSDITGQVYYDPGQSDVAREQLNQFIEKYDKDWGSDLMGGALVDGEVLLGYPADQITRTTEDPHTELVVVGTTGQSKIKDFLGSVSRSVIENAKCPVLVIPRDSGYKQTKTIIAAAQSVDDIPYIREGIQKLFGSEGLQIEFISVKNDVDPGKDKDLTILNGEDAEHTLSTYIDDHQPDLVVVWKKKHSFWESLFHSSFSKNLAMLSHIPVLVLH